LKKPVNTISKDSSSGSTMRSHQSAPSALCSTLSKHSSRALPNEAIIRAELRRLFRWLKEKGVTAVITCERGDGTLTRYGLEEYVADCVILLDHRVQNQISTRRLRIVKYRGTSHGTNEYPFFIDEKGISVPADYLAWFDSQSAD
jgi:KaiC/GvpD/RAD55 family RecA-like ATPase